MQFCKSIIFPRVLSFIIQSNISIIADSEEGKTESFIDILDTASSSTSNQVLPAATNSSTTTPDVLDGSSIPDYNEKNGVSDALPVDNQVISGDNQVISGDNQVTGGEVMGQLEGQGNELGNTDYPVSEDSG